MTTDHTQLPTLAELRATLTERNRKYDQAMQDVVDGQLELLSATWAALERGEATWPDLYAVAEQCRAGNVGGWTVRWNEVVPISWQKVQYYAQQGTPPPLPKPRRAPAEYLAGHWDVTRAIGERMVGSYPHPGTYAVYELFGGDGRPLYIGASSDLTARLRAHRDKPWVACKAREARDKLDAEALEAVEILTKRPPLNKQPTSYGGARGLLTAARAGSLATPRLEYIVAVLHAEASAQAAAAAVEGDAEGFTSTPWSELVETDPAKAEWIWTNTVGNFLHADDDRVRQIIADRKQSRLAAVKS